MPDPDRDVALRRTVGTGRSSLVVIPAKAGISSPMRLTHRDSRFRGNDADWGYRKKIHEMTANIGIRITHDQTM